MIWFEMTMERLSSTGFNGDTFLLRLRCCLGFMSHRFPLFVHSHQHTKGCCLLYINYPAPNSRRFRYNFLCSFLLVKNKKHYEMYMHIIMYIIICSSQVKSKPIFWALFEFTIIKSGIFPFVTSFNIPLWTISISKADYSKNLCQCIWACQKPIWNKLYLLCLLLTFMVDTLLMLHSVERE